MVMLDIRYLRDNPDEAEARLHKRGEAVGLAPFRALDGRRRELLGESEALKAERNNVSALIGRTKDKGQVQGEMARRRGVLRTRVSPVRVLKTIFRPVVPPTSSEAMNIPQRPNRRLAAWTARSPHSGRAARYPPRALSAARCRSARGTRPRLRRSPA